jgi:hypothetical protein
VKILELLQIKRWAKLDEHDRIWRDSGLRQQIELIQTMSRMEVGGSGISCAPTPRSLGADRKATVAAYKAEVLSKTGRRLNHADIWQAARYKDKSVFYRWLAGKCNSESIERVLREKPQLQPPPKPLEGHLA